MNGYNNRIWFLKAVTVSLHLIFIEQ